MVLCNLVSFVVLWVVWRVGCLWVDVFYALSFGGLLVFVVFGGVSSVGVLGFAWRAFYFGRVGFCVVLCW